MKQKTVESFMFDHSDHQLVILGLRLSLNESQSITKYYYNFKCTCVLNHDVFFNH